MFPYVDPCSSSVKIATVPICAQVAVIIKCNNYYIKTYLVKKREGQ